MNKTMTANIGEWSELYALLKLIVDGHLLFADEEFRPIENSAKRIQKLEKITESGAKYFELKKDDILEIKNAKGELLIVKRVSELKSSVVRILKGLRANTKKRGAFEIQEADDIMQKLHISDLKSSSKHKEDLKIIFHDRAEFEELGFSIKSMVGAASTLFNASSENTNFIYKVKDFKDFEALKGLKFSESIKYIYNQSGSLEFFDMQGELFKSNLRKIDGNLPKILAELLIARYVTGKARLSECINDVSLARFQNIGFEINRDYLQIKIKDLLFSMALGLVAGSEWTGENPVAGGLIVVKRDGQLLGYLIHELDKFKKYLFKNTKFETPSTKKHKFGEFYESDGSILIKLNLQIRFIK